MITGLVSSSSTATVHISIQSIETNSFETSMSKHNNSI